MSDAHQFYKNIGSKRKAANNLRYDCPSEASYLAGYCLELLYKFAILACRGNYPMTHKFGVLSNDLSKIVAQANLTEQVVPDMTGTSIYIDWRPEHRYNPDWKFKDIDAVFDVELKEIASHAKKIYMDRMSAIT